MDATGESQAKELQPFIDTLKIEKVYCSSSVRTRQTASIITKNVDAPVEYLDELREILLGPWEDRLWSEVRQIEAEQASNFHEQPHLFSLAGAETFSQLQSRGVGAINRVIEQETADNVLVVSHGALLLAILAHYAEVDLSLLWSGINLPNCSHSVLRVEHSEQVDVVSIAGMSVAETGW